MARGRVDGMDARPFLRFDCCTVDEAPGRAGPCGSGPGPAQRVRPWGRPALQQAVPAQKAPPHPARTNGSACGFRAGPAGGSVLGRPDRAGFFGVVEGQRLFHRLVHRVHHLAGRVGGQFALVQPFQLGLGLPLQSLFPAAGATHRAAGCCRPQPGRPPAIWGPDSPGGPAGSGASIRLRTARQPPGWPKSEAGPPRFGSVRPLWGAVSSALLPDGSPACGAPPAFFAVPAL